MILSTRKRIARFVRLSLAATWSNEAPLCRNMMIKVLSSSAVHSMEKVRIDGRESVFRPTRSS